MALNRERAAEEARGLVRWLRPEFQALDAACAATQATLGIVEPEAAEPSEVVAAPAAKADWPRSLAEQAQAVRNALAAHPAGLTPPQLARTFRRARADRIAELLETLATLGQARPLADVRFVRA